jgi:hypothetical protein
MEISGQQAMSLLLDKPSCQASHSFWNLYMNAAMSFVKENFIEIQNNSINKDNDNSMSFDERIESININADDPLALINFNLTPPFLSPMEITKIQTLN